MSKYRFIILMGILLITAAFTCKTITRNRDWYSRECLLRAGLRVLPHNAKMHYNFGNFLKDSFQHDTAKQHYREALRFLKRILLYFPCFRCRLIVSLYCLLCVLCVCTVHYISRRERYERSDKSDRETGLKVGERETVREKLQARISNAFAFAFCLVYFLSRCLYSFFGLSLSVFVCLYRSISHTSHSVSLSLCVCVPFILYHDPTLSMLHACILILAFHNFLSFTRSRKFTHIIQEEPHAQQINIA